MWLGPNTAFVLTILGLLAIYCEFIWPGRIYPGLIGSVVLITGGYFLAHNSPSRFGLILIGVAAVLFIAEAFLRANYVAGALAVASLGAGFGILFEGPHRIHPALVISLSMLFGAVSVILADTAKQARRNKRADLEQVKQP